MALTKEVLQWLTRYKFLDKHIEKYKISMGTTYFYFSAHGADYKWTISEFETAKVMIEQMTEIIRRGAKSPSFPRA